MGQTLHTAEVWLGGAGLGLSGGEASLGQLMKSSCSDP